MSDFWLYFKLGLEHVLDWKAYDHILFLIALSATYTILSWKRLLVLVSLFTIGHSISLLLANYEIVRVSSRVIEFLIPLSILIAALYNLYASKNQKAEKKSGLILIITIFFGLIHGFGFAAYYKMINIDGGILPLLEFALGVEASQIIIVILVLVVAFIFQSFFRIAKRDWVLVVSSIVIGFVFPMLVENWIF
jgi:predicted membrane protein